MKKQFCILKTSNVLWTCFAGLAVCAGVALTTGKAYEVPENHFAQLANMTPTMDSRIRPIFHDELYSALRKYKAKRAMGVLMNSKTGAIVAMISVPEVKAFEPIIYDHYELGTQALIFTTAIALENGITKEYYVGEPFEVSDASGKSKVRIHDTKSFKPANPYIRPDEIMRYSSTIGAAQLALDLPDGSIEEMLHKLHLDESLYITHGLKPVFTAKPSMQSKLGPIEKATISFGNGMRTTPIQMVAAVNAFANGNYVRPNFDNSTAKTERVISERTAKRIRNVMKQIAEDKGKIHGMDIAIKTSSYSKRGHGIKTSQEDLVTVVTGFIPVDNPQYTFLMLLDKPRAVRGTYGYKTSAWNVLPTAGKILNKIQPILSNSKED